MPHLDPTEVMTLGRIGRLGYGEDEDTRPVSFQRLLRRYLEEAEQLAQTVPPDRQAQASALMLVWSSKVNAMVDRLKRPVDEDILMQASRLSTALQLDVTRALRELGAGQTRELALEAGMGSSWILWVGGGLIIYVGAALTAAMKASLQKPARAHYRYGRPRRRRYR
jgi:hypothetical protein